MPAMNTDILYSFMTSGSDYWLKAAALGIIYVVVEIEMF